MKIFLRRFSVALLIWLFAPQLYAFLPNPLCDLVKFTTDAVADSAKEGCRNFDVTFQHCYWDVTNFEDGIKGSIITYFQPLQKDFDCMEFDMHDSLQVDSVLYHGVNFPYSHTANTLFISFSVPIPFKFSDSIEVVYHGKMIIDTAQFFAIPYAEGNMDGQAFARTFAEPYYAKFWWPCKEGLVDKIDSLKVTVKTLPGLFATSNGVLKNTIVDSSSVTYEWKHAYPIASYLVAFAVGDYKKLSMSLNISETNNSIDFNTYLFNNKDTAYYQRMVEEAAPYFQKLIDTLGFYPFPKDGYAQTVVKGFVGGMENQTNSFLGEEWNRELLIHEFAHQWFGDYITCGSWSDIWLNEGFATYLQFADVPWTEEFLYDNFRRLIIKLYEKDNSLAYVYHTDTTNVEALFNDATYAKGSYVLDMLEYKIGWESFIKGLKGYLHDPLLKYSFSRTESLKNHMELSSGTNLENFFNYWVYGNSMPEYETQWHQIDGLLILSVRQQEAGNSGVPFVEMPIEIVVKGNKQTQKLRFENTLKQQVFYHAVNFKIDSLFFNPHKRIMSRVDYTGWNPWLKMEQHFLVAGNVIIIFYSDHMEVKNLVNDQDPLSAIITDLSGKRIFDAEFISLLRVPTESMASGMYLISISNSNSGFVKKFALQH